MDKFSLSDNSYYCTQIWQLAGSIVSLFFVFSSCFYVFLKYFPFGDDHWQTGNRASVTQGKYTKGETVAPSLNVADSPSWELPIKESITNLHVL